MARCTVWFEDAALAVLAGGRGERLGGVRKALVQQREGRPLLRVHLEELGRRFAERLVVVTHPDDDPDGARVHGPLAEAAGARLVTDTHRHKGAPAGLHAALTASRAPWVFLLACDLPYADPAVVDWLAGERRAGAEAVVLVTAASDGAPRPEPLHAFYHRRCARALGGLLEQGDPSFVQLLERVATVRLDAAAPPPPLDAAAVRRSLLNVNTPAELAAAGLRLPG